MSDRLFYSLAIIFLFLGEKLLGECFLFFPLFPPLF